MIVHAYGDFHTCFDPKTGEYIRSDTEAGKEPFMAPFPELLDVGIMGHCEHGRTGKCLQAGIGCYQDGLHAANANMSLEDYESILYQCEGNVYQIALGGCGDPDQHEEFPEILRQTYRHRIIPNLPPPDSGSGKTASPTSGDTAERPR